MSTSTLTRRSIGYPVGREYPVGTELTVTFKGFIDSDGDLDLGENKDVIDGESLPYAIAVKVIDPNFMLNDIVRDANGDLFLVQPPLSFKLLNGYSTRLSPGSTVQYGALSLPVEVVGRLEAK